MNTWYTRMSILLLCLGVLLLTPSLAAAPDAAAVFQQRWRRHDQLIATGQADRSWTWGPAPLTDVLTERYTVAGEFAERERQVQYFDKGRMEINDPAGDPADLWYVTSGRLPVDLMLAETGRRYRPTAPGAETLTRQWTDAYITAIGDPGNFPTYLDLQPLYESPGQPRPERLNQPATDLLEPDLGISRFADYTGDPATILRPGRNEHLVPQAFLDFMQQQGLVLRDGRSVYAQVYDPLYIFGLPVTPAVWVRTQVGGVTQPVLFQVFERRVLTYNPANPPAFRVEMGNVGAHYYDWRTNPDSAREFYYNPEDGTRMVATRNPNVIYTVEVDVQKIAPLPGNPPTVPDAAAYRIYRSQDGGQTRELRYSGAIGPGCRDVLLVELLRPRDPQAHPDRVGLKTGCAQSPSASRGSGLQIYSSYDGAQSFFYRGGA
jgi:hypothetical protein